MDNVLTTLGSEVRGEILTDADTLREMSGDFGRIVERTPAAVARPAAIEDLVALVRGAAQNGLTVTCRGSAHSQTAQGLSDGGILVDMRSLSGEFELDEKAETVTCLAGTTWSDLVAYTLPRGFVPRVLTNNLDVTIGGTLSVAGIGVASFRYGAQVDNVERLQVVSGTGEVVECDRENNRELFDVVRSGFGLCGIITRATIRIRRCLPSARTFHLLYDDLATLFKDEQTLITGDRATFVESWCVPCPQGFRQGPMGLAMFAEWFFPLHVTVEFDGTPPAAEEILEGLTPYKRPHVGDQPLEAFLRRLVPLFELWKRGGYWANAHPWMETILPWNTASQFIGQVLANLPPPALGNGHVLLWPSRGRLSDAPLFRTPDSEFVVGFGILPGVPKEFLPLALPRLNMASDLATMMGGKRYLSGYLNFDLPRWQAHYGDRWPWLVEMKKRFDPKGVLNPGFIPAA